MNTKSQVTIAEESEADAPEIEDNGADLKKKELVDAIVARSDELKKGVTRKTVEAAFDVIYEALEAGRGINIPPIGKVKINQFRTNDAGDKIVVAKLRLSPKSEDVTTEGEGEETAVETAE